jgi:putative ABC transport system substrate-binding protein
MLALATELRIPTFAAYRGFGATFSYGPEYVDVMRRVAEYVARILRGASPGELPMERWPPEVDARHHACRAKA